MSYKNIYLQVRQPVETVKELSNPVIVRGNLESTKQKIADYLAVLYFSEAFFRQKMRLWF